MMLLLAALLSVEETPFTVESFDGFKIDAKLATSGGEVSRLVILVGGSGPYDMDCDLTPATKGGKTKVLWLKEVSDALVAAGFAVVRYHKRPHQLQQLWKRIKAEGRKPTEDEQALVKRFTENPLRHYVDDCKAFAEACRKKFPAAKIYLLGGSEGTHVTLWTAHELGWISGVAAVGFYMRSLDVMTFEQACYRDFEQFRALDKDQDGILSKDELKEGGQLGLNLAFQLKSLDLDGDGQLSLMECHAVCMKGLVEKGDVGDAYRAQEAKYPSMMEVLQAAKYPVAFFQGMWDNQTPAYNAMAVELLAKHAWKKDNLRFWYFPKLGHCLDARENYADIFYQSADPEALKKMARELDGLFK